MGDDLRIQRGMERQLAARKELLDSEESSIGWKVAITDPNTRKRLGIDRIVAGSMTSRTLLESGAIIDIGNMEKAGLEPEIAIELKRDLRATAGGGEALAAIGSLAAAIEIVDADRPLDELEDVIAGSIYHRGVLWATGRPGPELHGITARITRNGKVEAEVVAINVLPDLPGLLLDMAYRVEQAGEKLRAGDRIISGSLVPPLWVNAGERVVVEMGALGKLEVGFEA